MTFPQKRFSVDVNNFDKNQVTEHQQQQKMKQKPMKKKITTSPHPVCNIQTQSSHHSLSVDWRTRILHPMGWNGAKSEGSGETRASNLFVSYANQYTYRVCVLLCVRFVCYCSFFSSSSSLLLRYWLPPLPLEFLCTSHLPTTTTTTATTASTTVAGIIYGTNVPRKRTFWTRTSRTTSLTSPANDNEEREYKTHI